MTEVSFSTSRWILGFLMNFVRCEKKHKGVTLSGNDRRAFLTLAQKSQNKRSEVSLEKAESFKK
ncbi:hypothetical protein [Helicobacter canis]|uniref:Uncharacterized protein n=1 Tax=Helicobacter canis TaxID=29419 RepID=A0A5M9QS42_9HELI|nr:hypothetical protein [Helicobacter canis]KAA8711158.1 hypothetical protein F4V45_01365 [Helicobacter canis]